jgi:hypothetical protein
MVWFCPAFHLRITQTCKFIFSVFDSRPASTLANDKDAVHPRTGHEGAEG